MPRMQSQKDIFRTSEGNAWFERNKTVLAARNMADDVVFQAMECLGPPPTSSILEIGCGYSRRLQFLQDRFGCKTYGLDPSPAAVQATLELGVDAVVGTADSLPYENATFDIVIFGFCLCLCDDEDLLRIAQEADRVLKCPGWLFILDLDTDTLKYKPYHHAPGTLTRKMSYKSMFLWHPMYSLASYKKFNHVSLDGWTDEADDWPSLAVLRKQRFH